MVTVYLARRGRRTPFIVLKYAEVPVVGDFLYVDGHAYHVTARGWTHQDRIIIWIEEITK